MYRFAYRTVGLALNTVDKWVPFVLVLGFALIFL